ncbi:MAG: transketolase family protein [Spirochaetaceae bacterium]|nr:transketolase family protein [Spirochaetaceae bacterium]
MSDQKWMRDTYAETLTELAAKDDRIVLLEADLMRASGTLSFKEHFPERFFNVGVAEANMVSIASGLSATGKIPIADTFAAFAARRCYDQFFISANYAGLNVKLVGTDPGVVAEMNGGTHMPFEDVGLMRNIPKLVVFEPCDPVALCSLLTQAIAHEGCTYMRLHRKHTPNVYPPGESFELGRGKVVVDGDELTIVFSGAVMAHEALAAAKFLEADGVSVAVIDMHTVKPIDAELILRYARKTGAVLTCENHQIINGLGSAVAEVLGENYPVSMSRIGVKDEFGEVGPLSYLKERFGLTAQHIQSAATALLARK